jgi:hypothetical protein
MIYDGLVWARVFGMAYNNDNGGWLSGHCSPDHTIQTAAGGLILEGSDGVIVTIATEGPDAGGAGLPWWRAKVDARWAKLGVGGSGEDQAGSNGRRFLHLVHADSGVHGGGLVNWHDMRLLGLDFGIGQAEGTRSGWQFIFIMDMVIFMIICL